MKNYKFIESEPKIWQVWLLSVGCGLWSFWMIFSWLMVFIFTYGGYFGIHYWGWLASALTAFGFRFVLEWYGERVGGKIKYYDPDRYPWWGRKIRFGFRRKGKPKKITDSLSSKDIL